jgi:hypothetical protein
MNKCCSFLIESLNLKKCLKCNIHNDEEQDSLKSKECKTIIIQRSSTNGFNLQGDFTKLENYDLFKEFLKIPLVQTYIEEVFRPNKEIKSFQLEKINGIFKKIEKLLYKLFKRLNIELNIPTSKFYLRTSSFDLMGEPATKSDLDCYTPLLFMEFWIYGKSFIKKSRLKKLNLVHNIEYTNSEYTQERAGCPEYDESKTVDQEIDIPIQINGKVRGTVKIALDEEEDSVKAKAKEEVSSLLDGKNIIKEIYVKNKIFNIVVK